MQEANSFTSCFLFKHMRKILVIFISCILFIFCSSSASAAPTTDCNVLLVRGGLVYDGSGSDPVTADILIENDMIKAIGNSRKWKGNKAKLAKKSQVIDASGMAVCPGFIDPHSHLNTSLAKESKKEGKGYLRMGVTTVLCGMCGSSPVPISKQADVISRQGAGPNIGYFIGLGSVRRKVIGKEDRMPTPFELEQMKNHVRDAMEWGAFGVSSGLIYIPGIFSRTDELIELAKVAAPYHGTYTTHMRNETANVCKALEEAIRIGKEAGVNVNISHIKCAGTLAHGLSEKMISMIESAQREGLHITADQYPYTASSTSLKATVLPRWAAAASRARFLAMLDDKDTLEMIKNHIRKKMIPSNFGANYHISPSSPMKDLRGKSIADIASEWHMEPVDAIVEIFRRGAPSIVNHSMSEEDVRNFMSRPWVMTCTDGSSGGSHPRSRGTFARKIRKYVNEEHVISLSDAVRRCTGLVADTYGIAQRGYLREGYYADITVFDPMNVTDNSTYEKPLAYATGFRAVLVNGKIAVLNDETTGATAGRVIKMDNSAKVPARKK